MPVSHGTSKYEQLAATVEKDIRTGVLPAGQPVPSIRNLMVAGRLSKGTVMKGLDLLERRGLVDRHPQRGYFVAGMASAKRKVAQIAFLTTSLTGDTNLYVKGMSEAVAGRKGILDCHVFHARRPEQAQRTRRVHCGYGAGRRDPDRPSS